MCGSSYNTWWIPLFVRVLPSAHVIYSCTFILYRRTQLTLSQRKTTSMPHPVTITLLPGSLGADSTLYGIFECGSSWSPLNPSQPHNQCTLVKQRQNNGHKHSHPERESMGDTQSSRVHSYYAAWHRCSEPFPGLVECFLFSSSFWILEGLPCISFMVTSGFTLQAVLLFSSLPGPF